MLTSFPRPPSNDPVSGLRRAQRAVLAGAARISISPEGVVRKGSLTYVAALLLIAAFTLGFHLVTNKIVKHQDETARVVSFTSWQRMLAQRIVSLSLERAGHMPFRPDTETEADLVSAMSELGTIHYALAHGSTKLQVETPSDPTVLAVYNSAPFFLNAQMNSFQAHTRALAAKRSEELTIDDADLRALEQAVQGPLLDALTAAVQANQDRSERMILSLRTALRWLTALMLVTLLLEGLFLYRPLFKRLGHAHAELLALGRTDPLTGCLNRRAFTQEAHALVEECKATGASLAVTMIDLDRFKSVNDRFGHAAGDDVIHELVTRLVGRLNSPQQLCRMGGEEFAILLRGVPLEAALAEAEEFRRLVANTPFLVQTQEKKMLALEVTISLGVAELSDGDESIFTMLGRADNALYQAKHRGRNRVEVELYEALGALGPIRMDEEVVMAGSFYESLAAVE